MAAQAWGGFECLKCSICSQWFFRPDLLSAGPACSVEAEVWAGNVNKPLWSIKDLCVSSASPLLHLQVGCRQSGWMRNKMVGRFPHCVVKTPVLYPLLFTQSSLSKWLLNKGMVLLVYDYKTVIAEKPCWQFIHRAANRCRVFGHMMSVSFKFLF